ncbi:MAG: hypothetical protein ACI30K_08040 [Muribaculaceae bacterium]
MTDKLLTPSNGYTSNTRANIMWFITALMGIIFGVLYFLQPDTNDECWYKLSMIPYLKEPSLSAFFESVWNCCKHHYLYDNGRFANVVGTVMLLLPRWISAVILGGAVAYCMALSARLAGIWRKSVPAYVVLIFLWVFALPWNDKMLTLIFSYNYICGAALSLLLIALTLRVKSMSTGASFAIALLVGLWHEGFAGPMLCAIAALAVVHRRYRSKRIAAILIGLVLGITYLWLAPGTANRVAIYKAVLGSGLRDPFVVWYYGVVCYATLALAILRVFVRRHRHAMASSPLFIVMLVAMLGALGVWRYFMGGARTALGCTMYAIVLLMALTAGRLSGRRGRRTPSAVRRYAVAAATLILAALMAVNLTATIIGVANVRNCSRIMAERYSQSPAEDIYIPLKMPWQLSPWTLGKVDTMGFLTKLSYTYYKAYYYDVHGPVSEPRPVPIGLKGFTPAKAKEIGTGAYKAYYYGHVIVIDAPGYACTFNSVEYHFNDKKSRFQNFLMPFRGADGKEYTYVAPYGCYKESLLYGEPTGVELIAPQRY